jgi:hypothetical protein
VKFLPRGRAVAKQLRRAAVPLLFLTLACNERPSDLREWRAGDHDRADSPPSQQGQVDPTKPEGPQIPGLEDVTIVAWSQNCTQCHGQLGRGDGPRGPMLKATDLSSPTWQASVTDQQIAASIKLGKNQMPSFKQLPDATIANLVRLVRMMNLARLQAHAAGSSSASVAAAPSSSVKRAPKAPPPAVAPTPAPSAP